MQMYQVDFQTHYENMIDAGKVIVCAADNDAATEMVLSLLSLPRSRTRCEAVRIKPSLYELMRREIKPPVKVSNRHSGLAREEREELRDYNLSISAAVSGTDEKHAMRRLAGSLIHKSKDQPGLDRHTKKLMVDCNPVLPEQRALKPMEQVELYKVRNFTGGAPRYANAPTKITEEDLKERARK